MGIKRHYNTSIPPIIGKQLEITYQVMEKHLDNSKVKACYNDFKTAEEILPNGDKMVFISADNKELGLKYTYVVSFFGEEIIKGLGVLNSTLKNGH